MKHLVGRLKSVEHNFADSTYFNFQTKGSKMGIFEDAEAFKTADRISARNDFQFISNVFKGASTHVLFVCLTLPLYRF